MKNKIKKKNIVEKLFVVSKGEEKKLAYFFKEDNKRKIKHLKIKIVLKENSRLKGVLKQEFENKLTIQKEIILGKNSYLDLEDTMIDGIILNETKIIMKENSELKLLNFHIAKEEHNGEIVLEAKEKNCKANIETRNLVKDGKTNIMGLIKVSEAAEGFEGNYSAKNIILGEGKVSSIPQLEIKNPDVVCTHSSTTETISEEQLFYLMTRGFDEKTAEQNILEGLFGEENLKIIYEELNLNKFKKSNKI